MILIIDNYDSFVHNLARHFRLLGHECCIFRNDAIDIATIQSIHPSHIVLSPGPCTPTEAGICLAIIHHFTPSIPLLGVCLGHQAIGQAFGAKIIQAKKPNHGKALAIQHNGQSIFTDVPKPLSVGLYHSLTIDPNSLPPCLEVTATSAHGDIMAITHQTYPCVGVQFHPESILTEHGLILLAHFLRLPSPISVVPEVKAHP